ncbi:hypothetical protein JCM8097_002773 [Rhodosporidiobolus ruineniae]
MATLKHNQDALTALEQSTLDALTALKRPSSSPSTSSSSSSPPPSLADIRSDSLVLLQLVAKEVTNLSLALKPPAAQPAVKASLDKVQDYLAKLGFLGEHLPHEGVLSKRINWLLQEALEALHHFLLSSSTALSASSQTSTERKKARDALLVAAKAFWSVAEGPRAQNLPASELDAVRGSWKDVLGLLEDALEEVKEMGELGGGEGGEGEEEDGEEEEDDEDDFRSSARHFSPEHLARIDAAALLLRLHKLLINRLFTRTAPSSSSSSSSASPSSSSAPAPALPGFSSPAFLSASQRLVQQLSALADDLTAALEPPQDELADVADELCEVADELVGEIEGALDVEGEAAAEGKEKREEARKQEKEWIAMWRKQRDAAKEKLDAI